MKKGKALFVCGFSLMQNSSVTFQNRLIIKGLKKLGFSVDVVCPEPEKESPVYDESLQDILDYIDQIYYIPSSTLYRAYLKLFSAKKQFPITSSSNESSLFSKTKKLVKNWTFNFFNFIDLDGSLRLSTGSTRKINLKMNEYEILISSSDPKCAHLIAKKLIHYSRGRKPFWIQYWGDPWFEDVTLRGNWKKPIIYFLEKNILSHAEKIVYASPITLKKQMELFPDYANKMSYANQASEIEIDNSCNEFEADIVPTIAYFGDYNTRFRNILPFYNASDLFQNARFLIVGTSNLNLKNKNNMKVINQRLGYDNIKKLEQKTHIFFAVCNSYGTQIPAKIYYWAGYRKKPIVVAVDGEYKDDIRNFLKGFGRYIICENTIESIIDGINKALQVWKSGVTYSVPYELTYEGMVKKIIERKF